MNSEGIRKSKNQNGSYCLEEDLPMSSPIPFTPHTKEKESTAQHIRSNSTQVKDLMHEQIDNPKLGDSSLS